jgi:hypothetical protein
MRAAYGTAAPLYRTAGWDGVLHLPAGQKWPPPPGWTGRGAPFPDEQTVSRWQRQFSMCNVALRLPETVVGIDVDCWDGKAGAESFAALADECGPLPATWGSTSREDGSRIRLFRVPPGVRWSERRAGPGIELIHVGHRYVVVWPSIHPEGRPYRWIAPGDEVADRVPHVCELPALPATWGRRLMEPPAPVRRGTHPQGFAGSASAYAAATFEGTIRDLRALRSGDGRNRELNRAAYKLGGLIACGELPERAVRDELLAAAEANGYVAKRGTRQALATINSGLRAGMSRPLIGAGK